MAGGKKKKHTANKKSKIQKYHSKIRKAISTINDNVCSNFIGEVPNDEELDQLNFPRSVVHLPPVEELGDNLLIGIGERGQAWNSIMINDDLFSTTEEDNFKAYSVEKKEEYRNRMSVIIARSRREMMYMKWNYYVSKKENARWDSGWDDVCWDDTDDEENAGDEEKED